MTALAEAFPLSVVAAVALAAVAAIVFLCVRLRRVMASRAELERRYGAMRESEQQLRHAADVMPALISYVGRDRKYRFVNKLYEAWFRCSTDEVVGRKIDDVLGPETMKFAGEYIDRVLRGEEVHFQPEVQYPAGPRWVDAHYLPDFDGAGQVVGFCVLVLDVTERKLAEDAVRQSEARLWAILDHLSVGVGLVDGEGRLILGNATMRGYVPERIPSRDPARIHRWRVDGDAVPPEGWAAERALRGETIRPGLEFSYRGDDGREVWVLTSAVPFRNAAGEVTGAIVVLQDITAHKEANRALQAADRRKDEFLATLAHELRNPLAAIRNAAAILTAMESSNPEVRWVPEVIDRQLAQMSRMLEDLLDVSRIAHDKLALRRQRVELSEVVNNAIETCGPHLDAGRHALAIALPAGPIVLDADPVRLEQVFSNLISNAAKYTPPGGHIRVTGERRGDEVAISVKDDGVGISPEMLPRLFRDLLAGGAGARTFAGGARRGALSRARPPGSSRRARRGEERRDRKGERVHRPPAALRLEHVRVVPSVRCRRDCGRRQMPGLDRRRRARQRRQPRRDPGDEGARDARRVRRRGSHDRRGPPAS